MRSGFTKGLIVGGIIAASVSAVMSSDMMNGKSRRRMMKNGRSFIRRSGSVIGDVVDMFR